MGNASVTPVTSLRLVLVDSPSDARQMLTNAEQIDGYLAACYNDTRNEIARSEGTYHPNVISADDHSFFQYHLDQAIPRLPLRLRADLGTVHVISLMPSAEGGMPHTRPPSLICAPHLRSLTTFSTLVHELWHIHQRLYHAEWDAVFFRMKWKEWSGRLPTLLEKARRYNPDTVDTPLWVFQDTWVPVPMFDHLTQPRIKDTTVWFYNVKDGYHIKHVPGELHHLAPDLPATAWEHPREMAAYLLADPTTHRFSPLFQQLLQDMGNISVSP
jgi:hypothetical protein